MLVWVELAVLVTATVLGKEPVWVKNLGTKFHHIHHKCLLNCNTHLDCCKMLASCHSPHSNIGHLQQLLKE